MFVKSLRLRNTVTDAVLRDIPFHLGANFIVDTEDSVQHNKVGKTTLLKLIDVAMGAKNKAFLYTDLETNSVTHDLKNFIEDNRVAVEITLVDALDVENTGDKSELKIDLFSRGRYYIDGEPLSQNDYRKELNILLFDNAKNVPTFRQLINSFVRISMVGDNNAFLKTLTRESNATYRSVYNYLFDISDPELDKQLGQLKADKKSVEDAEKRYKQLVSADDPGEQEQILLALEREYNAIKAKLDDIVDADDFQQNRDSIAEVRNSYTQLSDQLSEINYKLQRNESALEAARNELSRQVDENLSKEFFSEIKTLIPGIVKTFGEMIQFNNRLCQNKIDYFESIGESLKNDFQQVSQQQKDLIKANIQYISLVTEDRIGEYDELTSQLYMVQQDVGQRQEIISTLRRFETEKQRLKNQIESFADEHGFGDDSTTDFQSAMDAFNKYFTLYASKINGEKPILVYYQDDTKFPVGINDLSGSSTGTRKSLIAAYDLAYQEFAKVKELRVPNFIVHDVVESVEGDNLREIIKLSNDIGTQFIVAVLKEKLDSSGITPAEQTRLQVIQLSTDEKLFEGKIN